MKSFQYIKPIVDSEWCRYQLDQDVNETRPVNIFALSQVGRYICAIENLNCKNEYNQYDPRVFVYDCETLEHIGLFRITESYIDSIIISTKNDRFLSAVILHSRNVPLKLFLFDIEKHMNLPKYNGVLSKTDTAIQIVEHMLFPLNIFDINKCFALDVIEDVTLSSNQKLYWILIATEISDVIHIFKLQNGMFEHVRHLRSKYYFGVNPKSNLFSYVDPDDDTYIKFSHPSEHDDTAIMSVNQRIQWENLSQCYVTPTHAIITVGVHNFELYSIRFNDGYICKYRTKLNETLPNIAGEIDDNTFIVRTSDFSVTMYNYDNSIGIECHVVCIQRAPRSCIAFQNRVVYISSLSMNKRGRNVRSVISNGLYALFFY